MQRATLRRMALLCLAVLAPWATACGGDAPRAAGDPSSGAEVDYRGDSGGFLAPVTITIWDHGASEYWMRTYGLIAYETEERTGGELNRHTTFRGHLVAEREVRNADNVEAGMEIWIAGRYLVDIQSRGLALEDLQEAAGTLDLDGLAALDGT